jgi:hypothetical protein
MRYCGAFFQHLKSRRPKEHGRFGLWPITRSQFSKDANFDRDIPRRRCCGDGLLGGTLRAVWTVEAYAYTVDNRTYTYRRIGTVEAEDDCMPAARLEVDATPAPLFSKTVCWPVLIASRQLGKR